MSFIEKMHENAGAGQLLILGGGVLALLLAINATITRQRSELERNIAILDEAGRQSSAYVEELRAVKDLKAKTSESIKGSLTDMVKTKKNVYETGLALQEEKRLLEKQLEIMTTYLEVEEAAGKINLLRGEQTLKSFSFSSPLRAMGGAKSAAPGLCRIISKERYAYTERGKTEKASDGLKWDPPQTGETSRGSALGEFVIFTDGPLVLHAPVAEASLHDAYPHLCAGLTLYSAKKLYESVFIGNKLLIQTIPSAAIGKSKPKTQARADSKKK
jgi:hypothetical protein